MISYTFGYGYSFRQRPRVAASTVTFGVIESANGSPIASANGSILTI